MRSRRTRAPQPDPTHRDGMLGVLLAGVLLAGVLLVGGCSSSPETGGAAVPGGGTAATVGVGAGTPVLPTLAGPTTTGRPGPEGVSPPGPPAPAEPPATNTSVLSGSAATVPPPGQAVLFGGITVSGCPPSPSTCEDAPVPVPGTVRAEQLDVPAGPTPLVAGVDTDGLFDLALPAGRWRVSVHGPTIEPCPTREVTLAPGATVTVTFTCTRRP